MTTPVPPGTGFTARHYRIDAGHSNVVAAWEQMSHGAAAWPTEDQWAVLHEANRLDELVPPEHVAATSGVVELAFELPMPGVSYLELAP